MAKERVKREKESEEGGGECAGSEAQKRKSLLKLRRVENGSPQADTKKSNKNKLRRKRKGGGRGGGASAAGGEEMGKGSEMVMEIGHDLQRSVARAVEQSEEVGVREG